MIEIELRPEDFDPKMAGPWEIILDECYIPRRNHEKVLSLKLYVDSFRSTYEEDEK